MKTIFYFSMLTNELGSTMCDLGCKLTSKKQEGGSDSALYIKFVG